MYFESTNKQDYNFFYKFIIYIICISNNTMVRPGTIPSYDLFNQWSLTVDQFKFTRVQFEVLKSYIKLKETSRLPYRVASLLINVVSEVLSK